MPSPAARGPRADPSRASILPSFSLLLPRSPQTQDAGTALMTSLENPFVSILCFRGCLTVSEARTRTFPSGLRLGRRQTYPFHLETPLESRPFSPLNLTDLYFHPPFPHRVQDFLKDRGSVHGRQIKSACSFELNFNLPPSVAPNSQLVGEYQPITVLESRGWS